MKLKRNLGVTSAERNLIETMAMCFSFKIKNFDFGKTGYMSERESQEEQNGCSIAPSSEELHVNV